MVAERQRTSEYDTLQDFIERRQRLFILTGAGCSTPSGIPDYRDADGQWKRAQPVTYQAFMGEEKTRRRYWARSLIGWRLVRQAEPNDAHRALAALEAMGRTELLLTQNVDRLHQAAGSARVIDLHGRIDLVRCMDCERRSPRVELQEELSALNPDWLILMQRKRPMATPTSKGPTFRPSSFRPAAAAAECSSPTSCFSARTFLATGSTQPSAIWTRPTLC